MKYFSSFLSTWAICLLVSSAVAYDVQAIEGKPPLTLVSFGGAFTKSQMQAYVEPYRQDRQRWVHVEDYTGGLDDVRRQVLSANPTWDIISLELPDAIEGCAENILEPIDKGILPPAPDGTPASQDFYAVALQDCGIGFDVFATVVAYDAPLFPEPPTMMADFFDLERFPGQRALQARPQVNLEWALIADGVPPELVYEELSTDAGLDRAFGVLERLRGNISWWRSGSQPPEWLASGRVAMSSAWNGRVYDQVETWGSDIGIVWDQQVWNIDTWSVVKGAVNQEEAMDFITFATDPQRMADQANMIAYGPTRRSANALVASDVQPYLPTSADRQDNMIQINHSWWAERRAPIQARFDSWLERLEAETLVYNFDANDRN